MDNLVEINNLSKSYGKFKALDNITLTFSKGRIIGLLGPNGAGKTTLIKILTGLIRNYEGTILVNSKPIGIESRKIISFLPDDDFLDKTWTVGYAIEYYSDFFADFDREKAYELVNKLGLNLKQTFKTLSKGTREKLQLILTLSRQAELYIFDEPIAGVDPAARDLIFNLILENYNKEASIIISTHLISEAEKILDDFVFIKNGSIVNFGNVKETKEKTGKTIDEIFREEFKCLQDF